MKDDEIQEVTEPTGTPGAPGARSSRRLPMTTGETKRKRSSKNHENLKKYWETHPSGPNLKHGEKSRVVRRRFTDLRTSQGRELARILGELEDDLGSLSGGQRILMGNLAAKLAIVRSISAWIDRQTSIVADGKLLPIVETGFMGYMNAVERTVVLLYDLAGKRPPRTVDLQSYIEGKRRKKNPDNGSGE